MKKYDLVVVGSGVGLSVLDAALQAGWSCALIEQSKFGGTCLTRGCIPSKILVHPADVIREASHAQKIGLDYDLPRINWQTVAQRMWSRIDESKQIEHSIDYIHSLTTYKGTGEFTGPDTMRVIYEDDTYSEVFQASRFVLATGGRSFIPDIPGLQETGCLDAERFFGSGFPDKPWQSLVIIGGGAIGAEFAHIFSAFGTKVTIVEMLSTLVSTEEESISEMLAVNFRAYDIDVYTSHKAARVRQEHGQKVVTLQENDTGQSIDISCEQILVASGIRPNTDILHTERADIKLDSGGWIITNEFLETSQKNIWALGDINGKYQFRHKANYEAEILTSNLFSQNPQKQAVQYHAVPWAIFTYPQIAHVGLTEKEARQTHPRIMVGVKHYSSVAKGFAMGFDEGDLADGFVKLIVGEDKKILGAHIIGPQAAVLIQSFVYLMNTGFCCQTKPAKKTGLFHRVEQDCQAGGTIEPVTQSMVIHPSLSEVVAWIIGNLNWVE